MKVNDHNHNNALNEISDSQGVIEVTGEYTGGMTARGASHEHRDTIPFITSSCSYDENPRLIFLHAQKQVLDPPGSIAYADDGTVGIVLKQVVPCCCSF